jgi:hypothetical protein
MAKALSKLTPRDRRHYQSLKEQIKDGLWSAIEATAQIHEEKLYLEEYDTFDDFIAGELEYSRSRVYQMLRSIKGKAKIEMSTNVDILEASPSVAKEMADVPNDQITEVIKRAKSSGKVTAASVRKAKSELVIPIEPASDNLKQSAKEATSNQAEPPSKKEQAAKLRSIIKQHNAAMMRAIDDLHGLTPHTKYHGDLLSRFRDIDEIVGLWK